MLTTCVQLRSIRVRGLEGLPWSRRPGGPRSLSAQISPPTDLLLLAAQVRIFRPKDNSARLNHSADVVSMPEVPEATFLEGVHLAVARNLEWVPPHAPFGASGSMYIRPLLFASGANLILNAPSEFTFIVCEWDANAAGEHS